MDLGHDVLEVMARVGTDAQPWFHEDEHQLHKPDKPNELFRRFAGGKPAETATGNAFGVQPNAATDVDQTP